MRASPSPETWMSDRPPALSPVPLTSMGTLSTPPASEGSPAEKNQARSVPPELSTMAPSTIRSVAVGSSAPVHAVFQSASAPEAAFPVAASAPAAAGCACPWGLSCAPSCGAMAQRAAPAPSATVSAPAATAAMTLDFPCIGFSYLAVSAQLKLPMPLAMRHTSPVRGSCMYLSSPM